MKAMAEIPLEMGRAARVEWLSVSSLASRQRAAILSNIIINENLKLLHINYLARKVDVFSIFLLGHIVLVTELTARLCVYII